MPKKPKHFKSTFSNKESFEGNEDIRGKVDLEGMIHYNSNYFRSKFGVLFDEEKGTITAKDEKNNEKVFTSIREFLHSKNVSEKIRTQVWNEMKNIKSHETGHRVLDYMFKEDEELENKLKEVLGSIVGEGENVQEVMCQIIDGSKEIDEKQKEEIESVLEFELDDIRSVDNELVHELDGKEFERDEEGYSWPDKILNHIKKKANNFLNKRQLINNDYITKEEIQTKLKKGETIENIAKTIFQKLIDDTDSYYKEYYYNKKNKYDDFYKENPFWKATELTDLLYDIDFKDEILKNQDKIIYSFELRLLQNDNLFYNTARSLRDHYKEYINFDNSIKKLFSGHIRQGHGGIVLADERHFMSRSFYKAGKIKSHFKDVDFTDELMSIDKEALKKEMERIISGGYAGEDVLKTEFNNIIDFDDVIKNSVRKKMNSDIDLYDSSNSYNVFDSLYEIIRKYREDVDITSILTEKFNDLIGNKDFSKIPIIVNVAKERNEELNRMITVKEKEFTDEVEKNKIIIKSGFSKLLIENDFDKAKRMKKNFSGILDFKEELENYIDELLNNKNVVRLINYIHDFNLDVKDKIIMNSENIKEGFIYLLKYKRLNESIYVWKEFHDLVDFTTSSNVNSENSKKNIHISSLSNTNGLGEELLEQYNEIDKIPEFDNNLKDKISMFPAKMNDLLYKSISSLHNKVNSANKQSRPKKAKTLRASKNVKQDILEVRTLFKQYIADKSEKEGLLDLQEEFHALKKIGNNEIQINSLRGGEHTIFNTKTYSDFLLLLIEKDKTFQQFGLVDYLKDLQDVFPKDTIKYVQKTYTNYYELFNSKFFQENSEIIRDVIERIINEKKTDIGGYIFDVIDYIKRHNELITDEDKKYKLTKYIGNMEVFSVSLFELSLTVDKSELDNFFKNIEPLKKGLQFYSLEQLKESGKYVFSKDKEANNKILDELLFEVSPPSGSNVSSKEEVLKHYRRNASIYFDNKLKKEKFNQKIHPEWFDKDGVFLDVRDMITGTNYGIKDDSRVNEGVYNYNEAINDIDTDFPNVEKYILDVFGKLEDKNESQIPKNEVLSHLGVNLKKLYKKHLQTKNKRLTVDLGLEDEKLYQDINEKQNLLYGDMMKEFTYFVYKYITGKETSDSNALINLINEKIEKNYQSKKAERINYLEEDEDKNKIKAENIMTNVLISLVTDCICENKDFKIEDYFKKLHQSDKSNYKYKEILESIINNKQFLRRLQKNVKKQSGSKWEENESEFISKIDNYINTELPSKFENNRLDKIISENINSHSVEEIKKQQSEYKEYKKKSSVNISIEDLEGVLKNLYKKEILSLEESKKGFKKTVGDIKEICFWFENNCNTIIGGANSEICIFGSKYLKMIQEPDVGFIPMNIDGINKGYTHFRIDENQKDGYTYIVVSINPKQNATTEYGTDVFIRNVVNLIKKGYSEKDKIKIIASTTSGTGSNNNNIISAHKANKDKITLSSPVSMAEKDSTSYLATNCVVLYEQKGDEIKTKKDNEEIENLLKEIVTDKTLLNYLNPEKIDKKHLDYLEKNEENKKFKDDLLSYLSKNIRDLERKYPEDELLKTILKDEITNILNYCIRIEAIPYPIGIVNKKGETLKFSNYEGEYAQAMTRMS